MSRRHTNKRATLAAETVRAALVASAGRVGSYAGVCASRYWVFVLGSDIYPGARASFGKLRRVSVPRSLRVMLGRTVP
jgi:hypothetical protein